MEFNFPFPSLQQLSILAVCQHWSDNDLGLFSEIRKESTVASNNLYRLFRDYSYMVKRLPSLPPLLKTSVSEVLVGICKQIHSWALKFSKFPSVEKLYFDTYGRFDIDRTVEHFYKNQVAAVEDLSALHELFSEAAKNAWLSEIDMVLRKMVAVVIQPMDVQLEGPSYVLQDGDLVMCYRFLQKLDSRNSDKLNCLASLRSDYASTCSNKRFLVVQLSPSSWNFESFKKLYNLHESSERNNVVRRFFSDSLWSSGKFLSRSHFLQALTFIEKVNEQSWISNTLIGNDSLGICSRIFDCSLTWPFTTFFAPACELLSPHFETHLILTGRFLFRILENSLHDQGCVALHCNLLREFWSSLSRHAKRYVAICYRNRINYVLAEITGREESGQATVSICNAIMADLNAFWTGNVSGLQRKRSHE